MESVKRYGHIGYLATANHDLIRLYPEMDIYVLASDFDRVSAENLALHQRLTVQDQREDDLKGLIKEALDELQEIKKSVGFRGYTLAVIGLLEAALKPTTEAEPQCLLCLDKKTVPSNLVEEYVMDCPDCCGEEG